MNAFCRVFVCLSIYQISLKHNWWAALQFVTLETFFSLLEVKCFLHCAHWLIIQCCTRPNLEPMCLHMDLLGTPWELKVLSSLFQQGALSQLRKPGCTQYSSMPFLSDLWLVKQFLQGLLSITPSALHPNSCLMLCNCWVYPYSHAYTWNLKTTLPHHFGRLEGFRVKIADWSDERDPKPQDP